MRPVQSSDPRPTSGERPLAGVRVLDLGQYIAGPLVATLLGDQGAAVVRIEPPDGPRWRAPANAVLHRGRETRRLDLRDAGDRRTALGLVASADVLVENFRPGVAERLGLGWTTCQAVNRRLIYCSLPAFGAADQRAAEPGWEGVVMAAAGAYARVSPNPLLGSGWWPGERPVISPLPLASVFGASQAALAVAAALIARDRDGLGQRIEVPLFGAALEAQGARLVSYERRPRGGRALGSGLYRAADGGYVSFVATRIEHLKRLLEAADAAASLGDLADFDRLGRDRDARAELGKRLVKLFATHTSHEWEEVAIATGLPMARVCSLDEWLRTPSALASGAIVECNSPNLGPVRVVGPAVRVTRVGVGAAPRATPISPDTAPLAGVRVLDLTRVMAGPTATRLLAELGADVVQADADPLARRTGYREPLFHEHLNRGKRSIVMDLRTVQGRELRRELVSWADVVVTNFSLPALERLRLSPEDIRRVRPDVVFVYLNAFGTSGPWARRRGFAETANVASGVTWRTLGEVPSGIAPQVDFPRSPFTDYLAGTFAAFAAAVALLDRRRTGAGQIAETSLLHAACYAQLPYMLHYEGKQWPEERRLDARGWRTLHRLYAAADGWLFIGGREDRRHAVAAAFGIVADASFEDALAGALASRPREECAYLLGRAGVAAQAVLDAAEVMAPGGPADIAGLRDAQQSSQFGLVVAPASAIRFERTPTRTGELPGPFGCNEDEIRAQLAAEATPEQ
jgi:crotonobetainyl-CoA:carnitine CoA-transferase CaiB-like acyl-CoA transferase